MTQDNKTILLDFDGYSHYLVPYGNRVIPKDKPVDPNYRVIKTDYVHLQVTVADMEPTILHDSFAYGEIVDWSGLKALTGGVYAAAMLNSDGRQIAQIVVGRLKDSPTQSLTLWSDRPGHIPKKVLPIKNIAFLFRLTWSAPRELYWIIPR
ncbi:hypothetical protein [Spirosoma koreense]